MPSVRRHLGGAPEPGRFLQVLSRPAHLNAYALMAALVMSTFTVGPFVAVVLEKNVGRTPAEIPLVYLFGGAATLVSMNLVGRLADYFPRLTVFRVFALLSVLSILALTHLHAGASLTLTLLATTAMFVLTSGRMVPAM